MTLNEMLLLTYVVTSILASIGTIVYDCKAIGMTIGEAIQRVIVCFVPIVGTLCLIILLIVVVSDWLSDKRIPNWWYKQLKCNKKE